MPRSLLPEHQAETATTAVAAATPGGCNDASTDGPDERSDEPRGHGCLHPALRQGGARRHASPPHDGPGRWRHPKPCQCCSWQAWLQCPPQPECAGSRQKGSHTIITLPSRSYPCQSANQCTLNDPKLIPIYPMATQTYPSHTQSDQPSSNHKLSIGLCLIDSFRRCRRRLRTSL